MEEVRLTDYEFTEIARYLSGHYPSSYVLEGDGLHKRIGPAISKAAFTTGELLEEFKKAHSENAVIQEWAEGLLAGLKKERRNCEECNSLYIVKRKRQRFCSPRCSNAWHQRQHRERNGG